MKTKQKLHSASMMWTSALLTLALVGTALAKDDKNSHQDGDHNEPAKTLYVWAGD
jgi:hypothetical protein